MGGLHVRQGRATTQTPREAMRHRVMGMGDHAQRLASVAARRHRAALWCLGSRSLFAPGMGEDGHGAMQHEPKCVKIA